MAVPVVFGAVMLMVAHGSSGAAASTVVPHVAAGGIAPRAIATPSPAYTPLRVAATAHDPFTPLSAEGAASSSSPEIPLSNTSTTTSSTTNPTTVAPSQPQPQPPAAVTPPVYVPPAPQPSSNPVPALTHDLDGYAVGLVTSQPAPCNSPLVYTPGSAITLTDDASGKTLASSTISSCAGVSVAAGVNQQNFYFAFAAAPLKAKMHLHLNGKAWPLTLAGMQQTYGFEFVLGAPGHVPSAYPTS